MAKVLLWAHVAFALSVGMQAFSEPTNSAPAEKASEAVRAKDVAALPIEAAFRRGMGSIKEQVNLLDPKGSIAVCRTKGAWLICLTNYADIPERFLQMSVMDNGPISYRFASAVTNITPTDWLKSGRKANLQGSKMLMRPEAAFRKGLNALIQWRHQDPSRLENEQGRITLSPDADGWLMDVFGYPGPGLGGWWITIRTNGDVLVRSGI